MSKKKILIVDDDLDIRLGLSARLGASGFETGFAEDGPSALAGCRDLSPDLVILDLGLPDEDGFAVLERIKGDPDLNSIPVIILSARDVYENEKRSLDLGAHGFFQKPADNAALLSSIHAALG